MITTRISIGVLLVTLFGETGCSSGLAPPLQTSASGTGASTSATASSSTTSSASTSGTTGTSGAQSSTGNSSGGGTSGSTTGAGTSTSSTGSSTGGFVPGPTCNPANPSCDTGTVCSLVAPTTTSIGFQCQPPAEFYPCSPGSACADTALSCTTFGNGSFCVQSCTTSDDCGDPLAVCQASGTGKYCLPSQCGPKSVPANGTALFASCNAAATGDGQCLDLAFANGAPGVCMRTGTIAEGETCAYYVPGAGSAGLCQDGTTCFVSLVNGRSSRCATVCDTTHPCSPTQTCLIAVPPINPPPLSAFTVSIAFGACLDLCTLGEDGGCPTGFTCRQNPVGTGGACDPD